MSYGLPDTEEVRLIFERAIAKALYRKARLGQYAVIWRDGKVVELQPDEIFRLLDERKHIREGLPPQTSEPSAASESDSNDATTESQDQ